MYLKWYPNWSRILEGTEGKIGPTSLTLVLASNTVYCTAANMHDILYHDLTINSI